MSKPSFEEILNIKRKVDIVDIIGDYLPLVKKGKNYWAVCPFHDDHSPSMSISSDRQMYKCFTCGEGGDVFRFIQNYEKISYAEAVNKVAKKLGINFKIENTKKNTDTKFHEQYEIYDISNKYYQNNLNTSLGKIARNYLKTRTISDDVIKQFQIGLSLNDNKLCQLLNSKGYSDDLLVKSGIAAKNDNRVYDIYRNRIMFPLWDINGKTIGFSGRRYEENDQSKYINTMETDIFKKGSLLYNYHNAREHVIKEGKIIITEGFMDVIRLYTIGVYNVVATMGTAVTNEQVNLISKISKNVILMFDGDAAGAHATDSFIEVSKNVNFDIKVVRLEDDLDPDEYILKNGKDSMMDHLNHPKSLFDYEIINLKNKYDFDNSNDVSKFISEISKILSKIDDDIVLNLEVKKISNLTGVDENLIKSKIEKKEDKKVVKEIEVKKTTIKKETKYDKASKMILYYMIKHNNLILYYYNNLSYLPSDVDRKLANEIVLFYKKYNSFNINDFITYLEDNSVLINRVLEIDSLTYKEEYTLEEIDSYFNVIKEYSSRKQIAELSNKLKNETNVVVRKELAKKIMEIRVKECK